MNIIGNTEIFRKLKKIQILSFTSVRNFNELSVDILGSLINIQTLEIGYIDSLVVDDKFDSFIHLVNLQNIRFEQNKVSKIAQYLLNLLPKLSNLKNLELINVEITNDFNSIILQCRNLTKLLIFPCYDNESALSNQNILNLCNTLPNNLKTFIWGITKELTLYTNIFWSNSTSDNSSLKCDSIPFIGPLPKIFKDITCNSSNDILTVKAQTPYERTIQIIEIAKLLSDLNNIYHNKEIRIPVVRISNI